MNYIGNIIKQYRDMLGISRKKLSENICSEKYIYLIEKGERTPSAEMIRLIGNRLGVDLFDHFQYLDCINPIEVRDIMKKIILCRQKCDYYTIKEVMDAAIHLPDFQHKPWIYEIEINRLSYMIFVEHKYHQAIHDLNDLIKSIDDKYTRDVYMANIYVLLSTAYQVTGDLLKANELISSAKDLVRGKEKIERFAPIITGVKICSVTLDYSSRKFHEVIEKCRELIEYQDKYNSRERVFYAFFYLAFAYYKVEAYDKAVKWFQKGIYSVLIKDRPICVYYISSQDVFCELLNCGKLNREMVHEFKKKYNIQ